jgi:hypothetical protein
VIRNLDEILEKGNQVFDFGMPVDGITPKFEGTPSIQFVAFEMSKAKVSEDLKHISIHCDRGGLKAPKRAKQENVFVILSFRYCGQCKVVSYCSKECQTKNWKEQHKNWCKDKTH